MGGPYNLTHHSQGCLKMAQAFPTGLALKAPTSSGSLPRPFEGAGETAWATDGPPHLTHHIQLHILLTPSGKSPRPSWPEAPSHTGSPAAAAGTGGRRCGRGWLPRGDTGPPARAPGPTCCVGLRHWRPLGLLPATECPSSKRHPHPSVPEQPVSAAAVSPCCRKRCGKCGFK